MIRRWLYEPFFHFILIGALLFAVYELSAQKPDIDSDTTITISAATVENLREQWRKQNGREPDSTTLEALFESLINQEVLFREAKRLGLGKNDTIVRRRLIQKMEFLSANLSQMETPEDEVLFAYYESHKAKYEQAERRSFTHIYFSEGKRGESLQEDAQVVLKQLQADDAPRRAPELGDNFILQYDYSARSEQQIAQIFGNGFAQSLFQLQQHKWLGPVVSEYGMHLLRVEQVNPSYILRFLDIREQVLNDVMKEQLAELENKTYQKMRKRYQINVDEQSDD